MASLRKRFASLLLLSCGMLISSTPARAQSYDFNATNGGWTQSTVSGAAVPLWAWSAGSWTIGQSAAVSRQRLLSPILTASATGSGTIGLSHRYNFEPSGANDCFDGGAVFLSVNGGAFSEFTGWTSGGYRTGAVSGSFSNGLAGLPAWCGASTGWVTPAFVSATGTFATVLNNTYRWAFDASWDTSVFTTAPNWEVNQVDFTVLDGGSVVPEPATMGLLATGLFGIGLIGLVRRRQSRG